MANSGSLASIQLILIQSLNTGMKINIMFTLVIQVAACDVVKSVMEILGLKSL